MPIQQFNTKTERQSGEQLLQKTASYIEHYVIVCSEQPSSDLSFSVAIGRSAF